MTVFSQIPMIEALGLHKNYGSINAVNDISFSVFRGEIVGFLGPNGAGKSTTIKMLTGYLRATEGVGFIGGLNVAEEPLKVRRKIGYLPENAPLYDDMMVIDFLRFIADLRGVDKRTIKENLNSVCSHCGLNAVLGKDISQLSKGYRQRVALAQALVHDPEILILDEPTSGLDPNQIVEIREMILDLGQKKTILLSSHILSEVQATCDRVLIINKGRLVADDTPQALQNTQSNSVIKIVVKNRNNILLEPEKLQNIFQDIEGIDTVKLQTGDGLGSIGFRLEIQGEKDLREAVFGTVVANDLVLLHLQNEKKTLEETFQKLTSKFRGEVNA